MKPANVKSRRRHPWGLLFSAAAAAVLVALGIGGVLVRGSHAQATGARYTISGDGTVTDTRTGLVWQQAAATGNMSWDTARAYCAAVPLPGAGWRIPSLQELMTLIDDLTTNTAKIDAAAFPGTVTNPPYWTSSELAGAPNRVWAVLFGSGLNNDVGKTLLYRVRCVR